MDHNDLRGMKTPTTRVNPNTRTLKELLNLFDEEGIEGWHYGRDRKELRWVPVCLRHIEPGSKGFRDYAMRIHFTRSGMYVRGDLHLVLDRTYPITSYNPIRYKEKNGTYNFEKLLAKIRQYTPLVEREGEQYAAHLRRELREEEARHELLPEVRRRILELKKKYPSVFNHFGEGEIPGCFEVGVCDVFDDDGPKLTVSVDKLYHLDADDVMEMVELYCKLRTKDSS